MAFVPPLAATKIASRSSVSSCSSTFTGQSALSAKFLPRALPLHKQHGRKRVGTTMQIVDEKKLLDTNALEVFMPALSSTMEEGKVVQWLKQPGDYVKKGESIIVVESDKADMDVESFEEGYLAVILVDEGETCGVGQTVGLIAKNKDDIDSVRDCGLDCIVSGSGSRHDGTTAVETPVAAAPAPAAAASPPPAAPVPAAPAAPAASASSIPKPSGVGEIFMPALSSTMTEGKIVDWLKAEGEQVKKGEMVMVVESDKADMDCESFEDGYLAHISVEVGDQCPVGDAVGYMAKTEADIPAVKAWAESQGAAASVAGNGVIAAPPADVKTESVAAPAVAAPAIVNTGRVIASPLAKKVAGEKGIDLRTIVGTGPDGRIVEANVLKAAAAGPAAAAGSSAPAAGYKPSKMIATPDAKKVAKKEKIALESVTGTGNFGRITADDVLRAAGKAPVASPPPPTASKAVAAKSATAADLPAGAVVMNAMQKAIVKNMNSSLDVPVFRVSYSICTDAFDALYKKLKPKGVTVSAMLAKAVAQTLVKHPILNAAYKDESIVYRPDLNIGMAVSLPDGGLITPVLKNADAVDIYELSRIWKDLVKRALSKKLKPDEYNSGTFFISNMGMFGVESFDAILPPGAPSILAVAASKEVVGIQKNGLVGVSKKMTVNMTCDHRHIYGAMGAEFLRDLADLIENDPMSLLL